MYARENSQLGATTGSYAADAAKQSEIPAMVDRLQGRLSDTETALINLEQRLSPLLRQEPATPAGNASPPHAVANTGLGGALQTAGDRVGTLHDRVCSVLRLLEI